MRIPPKFKINVQVDEEVFHSLNASARLGECHSDTIRRLLLKEWCESWERGRALGALHRTAMHAQGPRRLPRRRRSRK